MDTALKNWLSFSLKVSVVTNFLVSDETLCHFPSSVTGFCLVLSCVGFGLDTVSVGSYELILIVSGWQCFFLVIPHFWVLQSSCPLFCIDSRALMCFCVNTINCKKFLWWGLRNVRFYGYNNKWWGIILFSLKSVEGFLSSSLDLSFFFQILCHFAVSGMGSISWNEP